MEPIVAEIIERLDENLLELFEERAAIMEFDAGLGRDHAECLALLGVLYRHPFVLTGVIAIEIDEQGQHRWMLTSDMSAVTGLAVLRKAEVAEVLREHFDGVAAMTRSDNL
jgi:chorismate mutase